MFALSLSIDAPAIHDESDRMAAIRSPRGELPGRRFLETIVECIGSTSGLADCRATVRIEREDRSMRTRRDLVRERRRS
ncbi:hypothetical protein ACVI1L_004944 [Bradyrhizobium sp. USDA 4516]